MGCTTSQEDTHNGKGSKGGKGGKGKDKGKGKGSNGVPKGGKKGKKGKKSTDDDEEDEIKIVIVDDKPEKIRKDINRVFKSISEKREKLRPQLRPLLGERLGITNMLEEQRARLMILLEEKAQLDQQRDVLMKQTWDKDSDEVFRAYEARDKMAQINIFATRTRWQLAEISKIYEEKYGENMYSRLVTDGQKLLGKLITGSQTNLCKLLVYRIMPQDERDSALIRDFTRGMSIQDENLLEVLMTRTNAELQAASDYYLEEYGVPIKDALSGHSYKNYRDFMEKVLECNRDERNEPFDDITATRLATELYDAGAGRTIGIDPNPFIRIFSTINRAQFESLNEKYKGKQLLKDIDSKLGGDFGLAVKVRCMDKYVYLASRLADAMKSYTKDKDTICRVLGCVSRWECCRIREAYDKGDYGRSLEATLKACCSSEPNFLRALIVLISGDSSQNPMGSDKEAGEDEEDVAKAGIRARIIAEESFNRQAVFERGDQIRRSQAQGSSADSSSKEGIEDPDIPYLVLDSRLKSSDTTQLASLLKEAEDVKEALDSLKESVKDEVQALKESYFAINSHCYEIETWLGLLRGHIRCLQTYNETRDKASAAKRNWKG